MIRLVILALMVAAACSPAATGAASSPAETQPPRTPAPTPSPINVDDMMGASFVPATVFTLVGTGIHAVKLQNHHVPYRIPVSGRAHAYVRPDGFRLYVADRKDGSTRVRAFETSTGSVMDSAVVAKEEPVDGIALAQDLPDRLLMLLRVEAGVRVEAVRNAPLAAFGAIYKAPCGDRLLASPVRIAVICSSTGKVSIGSVGADGTVQGSQGGIITLPGAPIVASAMATDGTMLLGTAGGALLLVPSGSTAVTAVEAAAAPVVADGIAAADDRVFVVFTRSGDAGAATLYDTRTGALGHGPWWRVDVRGPRALALWPFAYFVGERGLWHVDLRSGLVERMLTLDAPVPLTVSSR